MADNDKTQTRQVRTMQCAVRVPEETADEGVIVADVLTYGVVDTYNSRFALDCFDESLAKRMPRIAWSHDRSEPIGRWLKAEKVEVDGFTKLRLTGQLDLHDDVPRARQAMVQLRSGTLDQFSVGFWLREDRKVDDPDNPGLYEIVKADLDEASPVLSAAVPETELVALRSAPDAPQVANEHGVHQSLLRAAVVAVDQAVELARRVATGEITHDEAQVALSLLATDDGAEPEPAAEPGADTAEGDDDDLEADAEAELEAIISADLADFDDALGDLEDIARWRD